MKPVRIISLAALVVALSGCNGNPPVVPLPVNGPSLAALDAQLNGKQAELAGRRQAGGVTASVQPQLAQIAIDAEKAAPGGKTPKDVVAFYRIAAVAAWQAGPAGENLVLRITNAGKTACEALPQKDKDAPRDCSLIRLALPMAVQDGIAVQLMDLKKKRATAQSDHERQCQELQGTEAATCRATRGKLPATDLPAEQTMFGDLETQFGKVSDIRDGLHNLAVPPEFTPQTDAQRLIVYCNAVIAWRLTAATETGSETFGQLASRKAAMTQRLQASGAAAD